MHDVVDLRSDPLTLPTSLTSIRCVTHKDVDSDDVARALEAFREITAAW